MEKCANTEALNHYLDNQEKQEQAFEYFIDDINSRMQDTLSELIKEYNQVAGNYNIEDYSFRDYIDENI